MHAVSSASRWAIPLICVAFALTLPASSIAQDVPGQPWRFMAWQTAGPTFYLGTTGGVYVRADSDGDGLPDEWETAVGLDPYDANGDNGAAGDPDRDAVLNAEEFAVGTAPLESEQFFAEGATGRGIGFGMRLALLNPHEDVSTHVTLDFLTGGGARLTHALPPLPPGGRTSVDIGAIPSLAELANAEFSTIVRSRYSVVADRTMTWDATGYGAHAETGISRPSPPLDPDRT